MLSLKLHPISLKMLGSGSYVYPILVFNMFKAFCIFFKSFTLSLYLFASVIPRRLDAENIAP